MPIGALVLLHALLLQAPAGSPAVRENVVVIRGARCRRRAPTTARAARSTTRRPSTWRVQKRFGRFSARVDLLNVTNARWEEVGLALPDFEGELASYYFTAAGFAARLGMEWRF